MTCIAPPELTDQELLTYLDGEADVRVIGHLEQCVHCRSRAQDLAHLQERLAAHLYRLDCPSPLQLGEFHLGLLDQEQAAAITRHLAECPHCTNEVAELKGYLAELEPTLEPGLVERVRAQVQVLIARLVSGGGGNARSRQPALAPAFGGLRGEEDGPSVYQAGDVQVTIEVQDSAGQGDRKVVLGLVMGIGPEEMQVHLWQAERLVTSVAVDEFGNFVLPDLTPDRYELILSSPETEIHIQDLEVAAS
jgi:anti-sigma factor RsiW